VDWFLCSRFTVKFPFSVDVKPEFALADRQNTDPTNIFPEIPVCRHDDAETITSILTRAPAQNHYTTSLPDSTFTVRGAL